MAECYVRQPSLCIWQLSQFDTGAEVDVDVDDPRPGPAATAADDDPVITESPVEPGETAEERPGEEVEASAPDSEVPDVGTREAEALDAATAEAVTPEDGTTDGAAPATPQPGARPPAMAPRVVRRRSPLRRGLAVGAVAVVVALAVSAFASVGSAPGEVDQGFVDTTRSQGYTVDPGKQQALLVSAAHKICDRRENHSTVEDRKATALSSEELGVVTNTFAGNARAFTTLALETYCAS
jgi:hypothetical protein